MASVTASGIGSGLDITSIVSQLVNAERAPQENRLASKEALIQARLSAYGSLKSALSTFQSSLSSLKNAETFTKRSATSSDTAVFTATSTAAAAAGTYSVQVEQLATKHKVATDTGYADSAAVVGSGDLNFTQNGESFSVTIGAANTLADIRDAVNGAEGNTGVTASIVTDQDGAHLVFSSSKSGLDNAVNVVGTGDLLAVTSDLVEKAPALDSKIIVDGFTQTSANLKFEGMIEGVTIDLKTAKPGESLSLAVKLDTASVKKSIEGFVTSYNTLITTLNDLTAFDAEANTAGLLQGDSATRTVANRIRQEMGTIVGGLGVELDSLAELGITTGDKGKIKIDAAKLSSVLDTDFANIAGVFSGDKGYATRLDSVIGNITAGGGILDNRTEGLKKQVERIAEQRETLNRRVASIEARYQAQFSALDTLLGQLNSTGTFLTQQLDNLPGAVFKK
ncbi:MAG: flagellar filament capping protein FliD [Zhongshania sp.]|uniref:flagellar filament capping protein FliD n=1 Tax=Zhongshania sp. TaxID=1971902 RepID=UPI00263327DD|nr:flagellar filament capping protein FliD [Zhongshania sp.]MDF1690902.1 flagellar filament capping protein FliD [Zhongshania sp.]